MEPKRWIMTSFIATHKESYTNLRNKRTKSSDCIWRHDSLRFSGYMEVQVGRLIN